MTDGEYGYCIERKRIHNIKHTHVILIWQLFKSDELRKSSSDFVEFVNADTDLQERVKKYIRENNIEIV